MRRDGRLLQQLRDIYAVTRRMSDSKLEALKLASNSCAT